MGNKSLFPVVAVPRAFFGTFFRFERKYYPSRGGSPTIRAGVGASIPRQGSRIMRQSGAFHASRPLRAAALPFPPGQWVCACGRTKGLSSGQTIGAVRTAVRSACCLPELRVANRLRRLYPLDTRFPSFPFGNLRTPKVARNPWDVKSHSLAVVGAPIPLSPLLPSFFQRLYQPKMLPVELQ